MNLLLLLSAFLSALTGAITGGRAPGVELHQAVAESRLSLPASVKTVTARMRPANSVATLAELICAPVAARWQIADSEPLYATRRRE